VSKDQHIARLQAREVDLLISVEELRAMMEEAMRIFALYLNVPESRVLQERWDKFKNAP